MIYQNSLNLIQKVIADAMSYHSALNEVSRQLSNTLSVNRISVWDFQYAEDFEIEYDQITNVAFVQDGAILDLQKQITLQSCDYPKYFEGIRDEKLIVAEFAYTHPYTHEFSSHYLKPLNIQSMLDVPIFHGDKIAGIICAETQVKPRKWSETEIQYLMKVCKILSEKIASSN